MVEPARPVSWKESERETVQPPGQSQPPRGQQRYDQMLKWMLTRAHDAFLALVAPDLAWRGERSPEVPTVPRYADLVWEVEQHNGERGLLHVELQLKVEPDIGERLAEYAIRLWRRDHLPVRSLVVYLRRASSIPASPFVIPWEEQRPSLRYDYHVVRLWELPQELVLSTATYDLWPLASLMAGVSVETTVAVAERLVAAPVPRQERTDLIGLLAGLATVYVPYEALLAVLRSNGMIDDLLRETGFAQAFIEEGERNMARRMALAVLEGRFGPLGDDLRAAVNAADVTTLQDLAAHVATETLEQVRARLGLS